VNSEQGTVEEGLNFSPLSLFTDNCSLLKLRQDMKADINADVDMHFERLFGLNSQG
jgi:hypothetical protein